MIYWTYDPLVARNAHLNFNVFGVRAVRYARDMYGAETGSVLHRGIGTDRLVVAWPTDDRELHDRKRVTARARDDKAYANAPMVGDAERPDRRWDQSIGTSEHLRLVVPVDVSVLQSNEPSRAASWRASTRAAFEAAFEKGYAVQGFRIDSEQDRGTYLLAQS